MVFKSCGILINIKLSCLLANSPSYPESLQVFHQISCLPVRAPNLPGNTYNGFFPIFFIDFIIFEISKYKLAFATQQRTFWLKKFQHMLQNEDYPLNNCVMLIVFDDCHTVQHILCRYERPLATIPQANSKRTQRNCLISAFSPFQQLFVEFKSSEMTFLTQEQTYVLLFANGFLQQATFDISIF